MSPADTRTYLGWLVRDAGLVEVIRIGDRGPDRIEWHTDVDQMLARAQEWAGTGNLFTTLHRIDPGALAEYREEQRQVDPRRTPRTPDVAIRRYTRLFFDFDPARPKGTSSTDAELSDAETRARGLRARLRALDWPEPLIAMSGNGWHLQYRTALPNTDETREILRTIYRGLDSELTDDVVTFDVTVRNPARLCAIYGSTKRKGADTPERPHRQSRCWIPSDWRQVMPRQVEALANHYARLSSTTRMDAPQAPQEPRTAVRVSGRGNYATLDVVRWFQAHDAYVGHLADNKHGVRCPWSDEHTSPSPRSGSDTIVYESDGGWPGFYCHHSHCAGRSIRDVMARWGDADAYCAEAFRARRAA
ncbi:hypothetical protein [Thiorhodococcus minor]|uniref:Uncharacterized protein n=1 Tax=Thiorhodococcus minor TaxID=57489 RepID=A0A6M0JX54_9GAMM|nr:hypothetical protein [Thiorhodococcus minor]NEV61654.1 hypothetical protein [Thiorhodococcus minor]